MCLAAVQFFVLAVTCFFAFFKVKPLTEDASWPRPGTLQFLYVSVSFLWASVCTVAPLAEDAPCHWPGTLAFLLVFLDCQCVFVFFLVFLVFLSF